MFVYNIVFVINFILGFSNFFTRKKFLFIFSFVIVNFFLCFNYMNGIDWTNYQTFFLKLRPLDEIILKNLNINTLLGVETDEKVFYYSMSFFKIFSENYEIYQYIVLTICLAITYKTLNKYLKYSMIGIFIYYITFLQGNYFEPALRQLVALSIFYNSLKNIKNKELLGYLIKISIAVLFHKSAIILLPLYFIPKRKVNIKLIIVGVVTLSFMSNFLLNLFNIFSNFIPGVSKYSVYILSENYGLENNINLIYLIKIIIYIFIGYFVEKYRKHVDIKDDIFYFLINLYWLRAAAFILQRQLIIFYRIEYYFSIFFVIILAYMIKIIYKKYGKIFGVGLYLIYSILLYRFYYISMNSWKEKDPMKVFPYTNYIVEVIKGTKFKNSNDKIEYRLRNRIK